MSQCTDCSSRPSDAQNFSCPPKMADGRHFTDYRPRCFANFTETNMNSYQYRQYMINNAESIISNNKSVASSNNACGPCMEPFDQGTMLPEQTIVKCDTQTCKIEMNDPTGLGRGRQYSDKLDSAQIAFMKQKEQENKKQACCNGIASDDTNYFSVQGIDVNSFGRYSVPSGGTPI